jgi:hypothetical protein
MARHMVEHRGYQDQAAEVVWMLERFADDDPIAD